MTKIILRFDHSRSIEEKINHNLLSNGNIDPKTIVNLLSGYNVFLSSIQKRNIPECIYVSKDVSSFGNIEKQALDPTKKDIISRLETNLGLVYRFHDFAVKY